MKNRYSHFLLVAMLLALVAVSCEKEEDDIIEKNGGETRQPVVIDPLDKPIGLAESNITKNSTDISWNQVTNATKYNVEYSMSEDFSNVNEVEVTTTSTSLTALSSQSTYYVRIMAENADTFSVYSDVIFFETLEDMGRIITFTNSNLEALVRIALNKESGDITHQEILTIDSLKSATSLESLDEIDLLDSLKYLNIKQASYISESDVKTLKYSLPNCVIIHNKWIEINSHYYELDTIYVETTYLSSSSIYQHEVIMKGKQDAYVEFDLFSTYSTLTEALENGQTFGNSTDMTNGTFHDRFSAFSIANVECPEDMKDYFLNTSYNTINNTHYLSIGAAAFSNSPRIYYYTSEDFE